MQVALWIDTPALGDTIAAIPTLRKLSEAYGNEPITVFTTKPFLFEGHPLVKQAFNSDADKSDYKVYRSFSQLVGKQYDMQNQSIEFRHPNIDLRQFHAVSLGFTLTNEEMTTDLYIENKVDVDFKDYVIIHPTHTWATRTWDQDKWQDLVYKLNDLNIPVIAIGRDSSEVGFYNTQKPVMDIDIKLGVSLLNRKDIGIAELRWLMNNSKAVITMDSGILHVAGTTDANIIQLGSSINYKLRAPWRNGSQDYKYTYVGGGCDIFCSSNMKYNVNVHGSINGVPPQVKCLENKETFECHPSVDQVFDNVIKLCTPNTPTRSFITHTTENYEEVVLNMAKSIQKYSQYPLVVYTIDYEASSSLKKYADCRRIDLNLPVASGEDFQLKDGISYVNRTTYRTYATLSSKIEAMIQATKDGISEWVYMDGDCVANYNVDDLFNHIDEIEDYPLATKGPHQYVMMVKNGQLIGNPFIDDKANGFDATKCLEWPLMNFFGMTPEQRSSNYRTTNILLANDNCLEFLEKWCEIKNTLPLICDLPKYLPYHEETLFNVLVWQKTDKSLPMSYINITGADVVKDFFTTNASNVLRGEFYRLPSDKQDIKVFHGEKRTEEIEKAFNIIDGYVKSASRKRLVFLAPHLSTGGMPEFLLKRVEALNDSDEFEVHVVEFCLYADTYVVQRDKIKAILGDRFHDIAHLSSVTQEQRESKLLNIIQEINPDIIHIEECPEAFDGFNKMSPETQGWIYNSERPWKIVETCHNIWFNPKEAKRFSPDAYALVSPEHTNVTFANETAIKQEIHFPIIEQSVSQLQRRKLKEFFGFDPEAHQYHLVNIGLWTPGKNQGEAIEWARALEAREPGRYQFHFVGNQASNFAHYWEPLMESLPANCHVWGERNDVDKFYGIADAIVFNSTWECNPLTIRQSLGWPLPVVARNLPQYWDLYTGLLTEITGRLEEDLTALIAVLETQTKPQKSSMKKFKQEHLDLYMQTINGPQNRKKNTGIKDWTITWDAGPKVTSKSGRAIKCDFLIDGKSVYSHTLNGEGHWCKPAIQYWADWTVVVDGEEHRIETAGSTQIIQFDSSSLGDSLSWVEPCVEFKNQKGLEKLYIATHKNWLFDKDYYAKQNIHFIAPGEFPDDAVALWRVGVYMEDVGGQVWFPNKNKRDWRKIYLGDIASDTLDVGQAMRAPKLVYRGKTEQKRPYICIATASTAQAKYWNNETGWQELVNHYKAKGYDVYHISKEATNLKGIKKSPEDLADVYRLLQGAQMFYGISSGLSWFAWATDVPITLISGFTPEICEFDDERTLRIINKSVCNSCWFDKHFDRGDWNWCPEHKGTDRQFECTTTITAESVIKQVEQFFKIEEIAYETK